MGLGRVGDRDLREVKIVDSWLTDVNGSGLIGNFRVNDVDVAPLVEAELDRRHPERVQLRDPATLGEADSRPGPRERGW